MISKYLFIVCFLFRFLQSTTDATENLVILNKTAEITMTPTSKTFFLLIVDVKNTLVSDDLVLRDCYSITL